MYNEILLILAAVLKSVGSQTFSISGTVYEGQSVTLQCTTTDFLDTIFFKRNNVNRGGCLTDPGGLCSTSVSGYQAPTRRGTTVTEMIITSYTQSTDGGSWTCTYGTSTSASVTVQASTATTSDSSGLSGGVIAGIVIGGIAALILIIIIIIAAIVLVKKKKISKKKHSADG